MQHETKHHDTHIDLFAVQEICPVKHRTETERHGRVANILLRIPEFKSGTRDQLSCLRLLMVVLSPSR
jgi:hypothetical protein